MPNTTVNTSPLTNVDWDDVLDTLREQRCVLFLGSSMMEAPGGGKLEDALCEWLEVGNPDNPYIEQYNPDGFFLFKKSRFKRKAIVEMKRFYNQSFPETEAIFSRVARIPFSMVFTLTPDNILSRTFDVMGLDYQPDFYFRNRKAADGYSQPTKNKPLIYNLLGNIEEPESLVLTHGDFFDYLESVFTGNSMNQELKDGLERMERYIFLGLPYEKWYFQLLLRVLSLHSDKLKEVERLALQEFLDPSLHKIYTEEFKIERFSADAESFIGELYRRCDAEAILKTLPLPEEDLPDLPDADMAELVAQGKTADAMRYLKAYLNRRKPRSYALFTDLVALRNQHNMLRQREIRGTIDSRDLNVENSQIVERLLELVRKAQNL